MNKNLLLVFIVFLSLGFTTRGFSRSQIPNYTPNVVDPHHYLKSHQIIEINSQLEIIRNKADIWGAVYLVKDLGDETIEDLAEKAFRKWKLGEIKKDNGLLLVLAMNNRKSRFEVGYGLEGDLPDIIAREALDNFLRPLMRQGKTKEAIISAFNFMAFKKSKDKIFTREIPNELPQESMTMITPAEIENAFRRGFIALGLYYFLLWIGLPLAPKIKDHYINKLRQAYPEYKRDKSRHWSENINMEVTTIRWKLFLSFNPGIFVFVLCAAEPLFYSFLIFLLTILLLFLRYELGPYLSKDAHLKYWAKVRNKNLRMVEKGYMVETPDGEFKHTDAYRKTIAGRISTLRSSSSRGGSSSSGGGRSGGGGSSSGW
jgi:uncharacterized protein